MDGFFAELEKINDYLAKMPDWAVTLFGGDSLIDAIITNSIQFVFIAVLGWTIATLIERKHLKYLDEKERSLIKIKLNNTKELSQCDNEKSQFLIGSAVIAHDYFRGFFIFIRKVIGGNISAYERILQRGRREALIRLKEQALQQGFNKVINVRFDSTKVANHITAVEVIAYGTAINTN